MFTQVRLDHRSQTVSFGTDLNIALQEDVEEGPFLQHMPGEQLRNQLQHMAKALSKAISKLGATDVEQVTASYIFYLPCHLFVLSVHSHINIAVQKLLCLWTELTKLNMSFNQQNPRHR